MTTVSMLSLALVVAICLIIAMAFVMWRMNKPHKKINNPTQNNPHSDVESIIGALIDNLPFGMYVKTYAPDDQYLFNKAAKALYGENPTLSPLWDDDSEQEDYKSLMADRFSKSIRYDKTIVDIDGVCRIYHVEREYYNNHLTGEMIITTLIDTTDKIEAERNME